MVRWRQQSGGSGGGESTSGRLWGSVIDSGRGGQRSLPWLAGQAARW